MKHSLISIILIFCTSCVSYSTLQTPEVLTGDEKMIGVAGTTFSDADEFFVIPEIYGRWATFDNTDMGIKLSLTGSLGADIKYQAFYIDSSMYISFDFGMSYSLTDDASVVGYYPAIFLGNDLVFTGAKAIIMSGEVDFLGSNSVSGTIPVLFLGTSIGEKFRLLPVANLFFYDDFKKTGFVFNLGIDYSF